MGYLVITDNVYNYISMTVKPPAAAFSCTGNSATQLNVKTTIPSPIRLVPKSKTYQITAGPNGTYQVSIDCTYPSNTAATVTVMMSFKIKTTLSDPPNAVVDNSTIVLTVTSFNFYKDGVQYHLDSDQINSYNYFIQYYLILGGTKYSGDNFSK